MNNSSFRLARALYIPAFVYFCVGLFYLYTNQPHYTALICIFGAMFGLIGFCAAIKGAGLINIPKVK